MSEFLSRLRQTLISGVTWKHPLVSVALKLSDPIDYLVRCARNMGSFPRMSVRARSNGLRGQFGGVKFGRMGDSFVSELRDRGWLKSGDKVLEIGCGCGRNAFAIARQLDYFTYEGLDIDRVSIESAARNRTLLHYGCRFQFIDVRNAEYNPQGACVANEYRFPRDDNSYDVVFLVSVFTHMMPDDVSHYLVEIARILKPGGRVVFTTFLMDHDCCFNGQTFSYGSGPFRSTEKELPEICVGYFMKFFDDALSNAGLNRLDSPVLSGLRKKDGIKATGRFSQDVVTAVKPQATQ